MVKLEIIKAVVGMIMGGCIGWSTGVILVEPKMSNKEKIIASIMMLSFIINEILIAFY